MTGNAIHEQERIAFHESGHAVIYHYFRHPVEGIAVSADDGHCKLVGKWKKEFDREQIDRVMGRDVLFEMLVAACAGKATMDRFYGYKAKSDKNWRASEDYRQAFQFALQLS